MKFQSQDNKNRFLESPHVIRSTGVAGQIVFRNSGNGSFVREVPRGERNGNSTPPKENGTKLKLDLGLKNSS